MKKLCTAFAALLIIVFALTIPVSAESNALSSAEKSVSWIKNQYGADSNSPMIGSAFCENAGKPEGDWYVIALKKLGLEDNYGDYLSALTAYISGKLRMHYIKIIPGDSVKLEMSPYDLTKGRIIWRSKN